MIDQAKITALLQLIEHDDQSALEELIRLIQPQLYRFSLKMCDQVEDAEDVMQESLIAIVHGLRGFEGRSSLSTWMFTIARRFCMKKRRLKKYEPSNPVRLDRLNLSIKDQLIRSAPSSADEAETAEVWQMILTGIRRLAPEYREILVLRDIEGLSATEVAEVVQLSIPAVKTRLHRARAQLRSTLTDGQLKPKEDCPDIRILFSRFLEGELSDEVCKDTQRHVDACPACATECEGLKKVLKVCQNSPCILPDKLRIKLEHELRTLKY